MNQLNIPGQKIASGEKDSQFFFTKCPMPMWIVDAYTLKFLDVNDMAILQYGYTREEFLSMLSVDIGHGVIGGSAEQATNSLCRIAGDFSKGIYQHRRKNGSIIAVEVTAQQVVYNGIPARLVIANDITERTRFEKELFAAEDRFRSLIENSSEGISVIDKFSNTIYRSPACKKMIGDVPTVNPISRIHRDDFDNVKAMSIEVAAHPGVPYSFQYRFRHAKGHYIWLEGTWTNMLEVPGVNATVINFRDITERKEAEENIRVSEESLSAIFDNTSEGFVLVDMNGIVKAFNSRAKKSVLLNIEEEIQPGRHILDFVTPSRKGYFAKVMENVMSGKSIQYDRSYNTSKGKVSWISFSFRPVWRNDAIHGICITGLDITERKLSEQQRDFDQNNLHALINNTNDLLWSVDREFKLITSNNAFDRMVKLMSGSVPRRGSNILLNGVGEEQVKAYRSYYERAFAGETFTEIVYTPIPVEIWSEISFYPIYEGDAVVGTACFSRSITEKKKAEQVITQTQRRLEQSQAISHVGHWELDLQNLISRWSDETFRIFGLEPSGEVMAAGDWLNFVHPDDRPAVEKSISRSRMGHTNFSIHTRIIRSDGQLRYIHSECKYEFNNEGLATGVYGIIHDVTDSRQNEEQLKKNSFEKELMTERLSTILDTLPASIVLLDGNGFIVDVNDSWRNFTDETGIDIYNYSIGDNYIAASERSSGEEAAGGKQVAAGIRAVLDNRVENFLFEYPCDYDGIKRWFRMVVTPLRGKEYAGAVIMHIDISELRRLEEERLHNKTEEQRRITRAMLQGQETERNKIGIELHDNVNQILVGTNILLQMARDDSPRLKELFTRCIDNITTAIEENRKIAHELVTPDLGAESLVKQLARLMKTMLGVKGIGQNICHARFKESLLSKDQKIAVYRVAQEQCTNIIKHAGAKSVNFSLSTVDDKFVMQIEDDGKGRCMNNIAHGIGLKNIYARLSVFGGSVRIDSAPGEGFILELTMPVQGIGERE